MKDDMQPSGWATRQSIALELDLAMAVLSETVLRSSVDRMIEFAPLLHSIPSAWIDELKTFFQDARGFRSPLEVMALMSGVLFDVDYSRATLSMRTLTLPSVSQQLHEMAWQVGVEADPPDAAGASLPELYQRVQAAQFQRVEVQINKEYQNTLRNGMAFVLRLIQGGDLQDRFWHWLDRTYYEVYAPWRVTRQTWLEEQEKQVVAALGKPARGGSAPKMGWMSEMSPVLRHPGLKAAVESQRLRLDLWAEPFGIPDSWILIPDAVVSTFARPGANVEHFLTFTGDLARRLAALSDPTRLFILRMIRNMDMTNTDMADYLKVARPTVSIHARILREAGLIRSHQEGRVVRHEIIAEEVHKLVHDLESFLDLPEED